MLWPSTAAVQKIIAIHHATRPVRYVRVVRIWMKLRRNGARAFHIMHELRCIRIRYNGAARKHSRPTPVHVDFDPSQFA